VAAVLMRGLVILGLLPSLACSGKMLLTEQVEARQRASTVHVAFLAALEAAHRAVISPDDEEAKAAAKDAEHNLATIDQEIDTLAVNVRSLGYDEESRTLEAFKAKFAEYRTLEVDILTLAVENTNLKAQRLAFGDGGDAADAAIAALDRVAADNKAPNVRALAAAAARGVRDIQVLEPRHIAEADDTSMDRMEAAMTNAALKVRENLKALRLAANGSVGDVDEALAAFDRFMMAHDEVVLLSRRNSNVRSVAATLGRSRVLAAECEDLLHALEEALVAHQFKATR
jgi:hypothetical protein